MFADACADFVQIESEGAELVSGSFVFSSFICLGFGGELFAAEGERFFTDFDGTLEEIEAAIVLMDSLIALGGALAGDLDALDIEFVFFVAVEPARDHGELLVGGVGRGGALEEMAFESGGDAVVEGGMVGCGGASEFGGVFELVGGVFGPTMAFETVEGGFMGFDAKAFGRREGQFLENFGDGHFYKPVVELVFLRVGK